MKNLLSSTIRIGAFCACILLTLPALAARPDEVLLAVRINGRIVSDFEHVLKDEAHWYLTASFLSENRLALPAGSPLVFGNREYYPLDAVPGLTFSLNPQDQTLNIAAPPQSFTRSIMDASHRERLTPTSSPPGAFFNHDIQYLLGGHQNQFSGLFEGGLFGDLGVLTTNFSALNGTGGVKLTRINTTFSRDTPNRLSTLILGDSITSSEMWGRQVYFAGVNYSTNFAVQPTFIPEALPGVSGVAVAPSVVDIYADNVKLLSQPVDTGPFAIQNVPVMTGQGQIQLVVTDALGRSQTITQSFLRSNDLLRESIRDFSYNLGTFRSNYGITSSQYRSLFFAASERRGLTDSLTIGARAELVGGQQSLGISASYGLTRLGIIGGGTVLSLNKGHLGNLSYVDYSRSARVFNIALHYEQATSGFWQIGLLPTEANGRHILQLSTGLTLDSHVSISAGLIQEILHGPADLRSATSTASIRIGPGYLSITPTISAAPRRATGVNFSFSLPFGKRDIILSTANTGSAGHSATTEVQRSLPVGNGYGYRVRTDELSHGHIDADLTYQNDHGQWDIEASQNSQGVSWRLNDRSGIAWLHGHLMNTRWLQNSFALVEVPHQPNVGVFINNLLVAHTNRKGVAMVPWLSSYNRNIIRIDDSAVPMDTLLDTSDRTVVPMFRSGVLIQFAPQKFTGATIVLTTPNGEPVPIGAEVSIDGLSQGYVAFHGETFLPSLSAPAHLHVAWPAHACDLTIETIPNEVLPRIGPLLCGEKH